MRCFDCANLAAPKSAVKSDFTSTEAAMGSGTFDPVFIVAQIIAMQCFFYLAMGTLWGISHVIFDTPVSLDHFFTPAYINFVTIHGWIETLCTLLSAVAG